MPLKIGPNAVEQDEGRFEFPQTHLVSGTYVTEGAEPEAEGGLGAYYASSDGKPHFKASDGTDYDLSQGTGGGGGGSGSVVVLDDGSVLGSATRIDFIGDGVSPVLSGETAEITIAGGNGGSGGDVSTTTGTFSVREILLDETLGATGDFSSISGSLSEYDEIHFMLRGRSDASQSVDPIYLAFNNDTTDANYYSVVNPAGDFEPTDTQDDRRVGLAPATNADADMWGTAVGTILFPGDAVRRHADGLSGMRIAGGDSRQNAFHLNWETEAVLERLDVELRDGQFIADSRLVVYGIKSQELVTSVSGGGGGETPDIYDDGTLVLADAEEIDFHHGSQAIATGTRAHVTSDFALVEELSVSSATGSVDIFIPEWAHDNYSVLEICVEPRSDRAGDELDGLRMRLAPVGGAVDSGASNYAIMVQEVQGNGGENEQFDNSIDDLWIGRFTVPTEGGDDDHFGHAKITMLGWKDTDRETTIEATSFVHTNEGTTSDTRRAWSGGQWKNTAKVGTIQFYCEQGNLVAGTKVRVYAKR